jgi:hypothetical protein
MNKVLKFNIHRDSNDRENIRKLLSGVSTLNYGNYLIIVKPFENDDDKWNNKQIDKFYKKIDNMINIIDKKKLIKKYINRKYLYRGFKIVYKYKK